MKQPKMTRDKLLLKPIWTVEEVMFYFGVKKTKGYEIYNRAKNKYGGKVPSMTNVVKRDSVLVSQNLSVERELYIKNLQERRKNDEKTL